MRVNATDLGVPFRGTYFRGFPPRAPVDRCRGIGLTLAVCCLFGGTVRAEPPPNPCELAGAAAEQANGLPSGLLLAIGQVESGRRDPVLGRMAPWPWTIDTAGKGQWFETKDAAVRAVGAALDAGLRSIDVGCFQINLLHHPAAFADMDQAFDPAANAAYAARFLIELFARTGSWNGAVEAYHSGDPVLGFAYRQQVFAAWLTRAPIRLAAVPRDHSPAAPIAAAAIAMPLVIAGVHIWMPLPAGTAPTSIAIPPADPASSGMASRVTPSLLSVGAPGPLPNVVPHALPAGVPRALMPRK